jgi:predicted metal-dependent RNase
MSVAKLKVDMIDAAQKYKSRYKQSLNVDDLDNFKRLMDVYNHLDDLNSLAGVTKILAGSNISISPTSGVGEVTISAIEVGTTTSNVLIDGGTFTAPNNALIDAGGFV